MLADDVKISDNPLYFELIADIFSTHDFFIINNLQKMNKRTKCKKF